MNTGSDTIPGTVGAQVTPQVGPFTARPFYWSVRRELWENRSIYIAPLIAAAIAVVGWFIRLLHLPALLRAASGPMMQMYELEQSYTFAALLIMGAGFLVSIFYCLDALYGERRDRSILFWKSMPVSDVTAVLAKLLIPFLIIPILTTAIMVATHVLMLLMGSVVLLAADSSGRMLWADVSQTWIMLLYHMAAIHGLWYAPLYAWLLLASAWARRAPFLWATLPLLAIAVVEKIAFNTMHFTALLGKRIFGDPTVEGGGMPMHGLSHLHPLQFLSSPEVWAGVVFAAICVAAAIRLRRSQAPI